MEDHEQARAASEFARELKVAVARAALGAGYLLFAMMLWEGGVSDRELEFIAGVGGPVLIAVALAGWISKGAPRA